MEAIYNKLWILYYLSTLTLLIYFCIFTRMVFWDDLSTFSGLNLIGQKYSLFLINRIKLIVKARQVIAKKLHRVSFRGDYYMFMQYYILQIEKKNYKPTNTTNPSMFLSSSRFSSILTISLQNKLTPTLTPLFYPFIKHTDTNTPKVKPK